MYCPQLKLFQVFSVIYFVLIGPLLSVQLVCYDLIMAWEEIRLGSRGAQKIITKTYNYLRYLTTNQ